MAHRGLFGSRETLLVNADKNSLTPKDFEGEKRFRKTRILDMCKVAAQALADGKQHDTFAGFQASRLLAALLLNEHKVIVREMAIFGSFWTLVFARKPRTATGM